MIAVFIFLIIETHETCILTRLGTSPIKCTEKDIFKHVGQRCGSKDICDGKVVDGYCRGKEIGEKCLGHSDCDLDLICKPGEEKCSPAADLGQDCSSDYPCKSYLYCRDSTCIEYGSIKNGVNPGPDNPDLCESHYINNQRLCAEGPKLKGDIIVSSPSVRCYYSNGDETAAECGYHKDGKAICKPGAADLLSEWKNLLAYLKLKPKCNPIGSNLGLCDYGEKVGEQEYLQARIAYAHLHYYGKVKDNPECVQKYQYQEYFEALKRYNGDIRVSALLSLLITIIIFI